MRPSHCLSAEDSPSPETAHRRGHLMSVPRTDRPALRLPRTLCIGHRVTPGSVAVLINRIHTPDLALPIDAPQERVFAAIDGVRSLDHVLPDAARGNDNEPARRCIEKL